MTGLGHEWSECWSLAIRPDGRILAGGRFGFYNGSRSGKLCQLLPDGQLDTTFSVEEGFLGFYVRKIQPLPDGKCMVAGGLSRYHDVWQDGIYRLNADASLDPSFVPPSGDLSSSSDFEIQADGKIIFVGSFNDDFDENIVRLNSDGSVDDEFDPGTGFDNDVDDVELLPDGKLLAVGEFASFNGIPRAGIARLNNDGSLDMSFNPQGGFDLMAYRVVEQPDGRLLVAGNFDHYNGAPAKGIVRLMNNGAIDTSFHAVDAFSGEPPYSNRVYDLLLRPDGSILVAGGFTTCHGVDRMNLALLQANGDLDESFDIGTGFNNDLGYPDPRACALAIQTDGKTLVGGNFMSYNGIGRNRIMRLLTPLIPDGIAGSDFLPSSFRSFPDPTRGPMELSGIPQDACTMEIRGINGQCVQRGPVAANIDVSGLVSGSYVISIMNEAGHCVARDRFIRQ